jgi:Ras-related protein Rab-2A
MLVANKVDLCGDEATSSRRQVSQEEGQKLADEEGLLFVEASAKSGQNIDRAFELVCRQILDKIKSGDFDNPKVCPQLACI